MTHLQQDTMRKRVLSLSLMNIDLVSLPGSQRGRDLTRNSTTRK